MKKNITNIKFIFIYRSFLYKFIKFKTKNQDLEKIVAALNIKNRKKRITYIYDEAIEEINNYYSKDLCQFINNKCIAARKNKHNKINGCCRLCIYQNNEGCKVNNLACKLFYCNSALANFKQLDFESLTILKCLSKSQRFILKSDYFSTREEVINDLYYGIIIATFRLLIRQIKQFIYRRINKIKP